VRRLGCDRSGALAPARPDDADSVHTRRHHDVAPASGHHCVDPICGWFVLTELVGVVLTEVVGVVLTEPVGSQHPESHGSVRLGVGLHKDLMQLLVEWDHQAVLNLTLPCDRRGWDQVDAAAAATDEDRPAGAGHHARRAGHGDAAMNGQVLPLRAGADRGTDGALALEAAGRYLDRCWPKPR
jgi:hypothetical protein